MKVSYKLHLSNLNSAIQYMRAVGEQAVITVMMLLEG